LYINNTDCKYLLFEIIKIKTLIFVCGCTGFSDSLVLRARACVYFGSTIIIAGIFVMNIVYYIILRLH